MGSLVGLMADSGRAHTKEYFPELLLPVSLSPRWATATPASAGDPPTLAGRSGSVCCGVTAPSSWVLMCTLLCVCPPRVESLFPPVLLKSCNQILLAFHVWFSGNSSSHCQIPQIGKPDVVLRTFTPVGGLLWYNCSPVCEWPTQRLWDLILLWLRPSYRLIAASPLSLDVGYLFCWVPVSSCRWLFSSCDSGALARGSECTSFYSAILNQSMVKHYKAQSRKLILIKPGFVWILKNFTSDRKCKGRIHNRTSPGNGHVALWKVQPQKQKCFRNTMFYYVVS